MYVVVDFVFEPLHSIPSLIVPLEQNFTAKLPPGNGQPQWIILHKVVQFREQILGLLKFALLISNPRDLIGIREQLLSFFGIVILFVWNVLELCQKFIPPKFFELLDGLLLRLCKFYSDLQCYFA